MTADTLTDMLMLRTAKGHYKVEINIRHKAEAARTVDLVTVDGYDELSICADVTEYGGGASCGQCISTIRKAAEANGLDKLSALCDVWDRWHMNGLRAGTRAQMAFTKGKSYDEATHDLIDEGLLIDSNYSYGSAWLVEPLPVEDVRAAWEDAKAEVEAFNEARDESESEGEMLA